MLTLEENLWNFKAIKIGAGLNILSIEIKEEPGKSGFRIQKQSNKLKILLWKMVFSLGIFLWIYQAGRLAQSTILEPEKYFRWDHFVIHLTCVVAYPVFYFTGSRLFRVNCEELVLVFNHLFAQRPRPRSVLLEQITNEEHQINANDNKITQGKTRGKCGSGIEVKPKSGKGQGRGQSPGQGQYQDQGQGRARPILAWPLQQTRDEEHKIKIRVNASLKIGNKIRDKIREKSGFEIELKSMPSQGQSQGQIQGQIQGQGQGQIQGQGQVGVRPLFIWPLQYSLDELLTRTFSIVLGLTQVLNVGIFAVDPSRFQLLYSALPSEYQNPWSFLAVLAVEVVFILICSSAFGLSVLVQLLFFSKCQSEFGRLQGQLRNLREKFQSRPFRQRDIRGEIRILRQAFKEMKELIVFIELFNRCFPLVIFAWKICAFFLSVLFYFFALRYNQEFPLLAAITIYVSIAITLMYTIMYGHAFSVPGNIAELKREFLLTAQKTESSPAPTSEPTPTNALGNSYNKLQLITNSNKNMGFWPEMKREIWGIRNVGVKVGSFRTMERGSMPDFLDFVLNQVVDLLVAFP